MGSPTPGHIHPLLDFGSVDLASVDDLAGYAQLLAASADPAAGRQSARNVRIAALARAWADAVVARLDAFTPGDALALLPHLSLVSRLAGGLTDPGLVAHQRMRAFRAHTQGDPTVGEHALFHAVEAEFSRRNRDFLLGDPFVWHGIVLERILRTFPDGAPARQPLTRLHTIQQVEILLGETLFTIADRPDLLKQTLLANHRPLLLPGSEATPASEAEPSSEAQPGSEATPGSREELAELDAQTLLLSAAAPYLPEDDCDTIAAALTAAIAAHPATNPRRRAALTTLQLIS